MEIVIGTRGSRLAMAQAESVRDCLAENYPEHTFTIKAISTKGDRVTDRPLAQIGGKGLFVREIEEEILAGTIRLAVHSMKDMPVDPAEGLMFARAWKREDARDALIQRTGGAPGAPQGGNVLAGVPRGAVIGTGSARRRAQLMRLRPDLRVVGIRGNVDTRLRKMEEEKMDGIVLAAAGLHRLGLRDRITGYFSFDEMIPSPAQGVLALEIRCDDREICRMLDRLADDESDITARAERRFLALCGGDCHVPAGAVCERTAEGEYRLRGMYGGGSSLRYADVTAADPEELAQMAVERMGLQ